MAMTPESRIKKLIKLILTERGVVYCMPATYGLGCSGVSDFVACHRGVFISIEAKAGKGTTTALQDKWLERIRTAGGKAIVVNGDNLEELKDMLIEIEVSA